MLKLNQVQKNVCALAVLAATSLPALAESVDVRVIGTITPTACVPTLAGGGTVDYGSIHPTTLNRDAFTALEERRVNLTITCDAPAKVAITAVNGRPNTVATNPGVVEGAGQNAALSPIQLFGRAANVVGLGLDGTTKIGGYGIQINAATFTADGAPVVNVYQNADGAALGAWNAAPASGELYSGNAQKRYYSWASTSTTIPVAFTTLSGQLGVQAYINKASELDLTKPIALDGLTTIELVYL